MPAAWQTEPSPLMNPVTRALSELSDREDALDDAVDEEAPFDEIFWLEQELADAEVAYEVARENASTGGQA